MGIGGAIRFDHAIFVNDAPRQRSHPLGKWSLVEVTDVELAPQLPKQQKLQA
jgi:hypothetical protein